MEEVQTVQCESDKKSGFNLEIDIKSDKNNIYSLILNTDAYSCLNIKATQKNDLFKKSFLNKFSVDEIKENKYFFMFDDLKEICNEISERIKKKEIKLIENLDGLNFIISLPSTKIKEIKFELKEEEKNDKDKINNLNELILKLKEEINEIKINHNKEINELKNIIKNQNREINEMKEQINNIIKDIKDSDNIISGLKNSLIINKNIEYNKLIKRWINPNIIIEGKLLYRLSRDGDKISKFHELCDNKGPTLTLFETTDEIKGGIYTPLSWDCSSYQKGGDLESFLFNLNKNKKYKKIRRDYSIYCYTINGPWIPFFGFYKDKYHQMRKLRHQGSQINIFYENGSECLKNDSEEEKLFDVKEVEVYRIKLN